MIRRVFVNQLAAGLAYCALPAELLARSAPATSPAVAAPFGEIVERVRGGSIGQFQRLSLLHIYSPGRTSRSALQTLARQNIRLAERLTGLDLAADIRMFRSDSPSAGFGSYSAEISKAGLIVTWQALARTPSLVGDPLSSLRLSGSRGIAQVNLHESSYQLVDFTGRAASSGRQTNPVL